MTSSRQSKKIKLARLLQKFAIIFIIPEFFFYIGLLLKKKHSGNNICIVAPPRSGSTLTYQLLTSQFKNFHLTNISNFLYTSPGISTFLSQIFCKNYYSTFKSNQGFVDRPCGEAEGLKFWYFWSGQKLNENRTVKENRLKFLSYIINHISNKKKSVYITGYLGHVYLMEELRRLFPKIIFIHIYRDIASNADSLLKQSQGKWFSTKPKDYKNWNSLSKAEQVVKQIIAIHQSILKKSDTDTICVNYKDICEKPEKVIQTIIEFAKNNDINIELKNNRHKVIRFNYRFMDDKKDKKMYQDIFKHQFELLPPNEQRFFKQLM